MKRLHREVGVDLLSQGISTQLQGEMEFKYIRIRFSGTAIAALKLKLLLLSCTRQELVEGVKVSLGKL